MQVKKNIILELSEMEAYALKKLLGNMNDKDFTQFGITGSDRETMREIWDNLDYPPEKD